MNDTIESESIKVPTDSLMMNNTNTNAECSSVDDIVDVDDNNNADFNPDPVIIQQVLEACEKGDITLVQQICKTCYKSYGYQQDPNTGMSPLMMSSKCGYLSIVEYLLKECSASWNARDQYGLCAGNYATDHQQWDIVNYIVDWATKCELILGMIQRNQLLITTTTTNNIDNHIDNDMMKQQQDNDNNIPVEHYSSTKPNYLKERVQYSADNKTLLDEENDAVMMEWERPIMDLHAKILMTSQHSNIEGYEQENNNQHQQPSMALDDDAAVLPDAAAVAVSNDDDNNTNNDITYERRSVLNIGYGLGIIDNALQQYNPLQHIIIEAHPDVYQRMIDDGWDNKSNVRICYGKWQDVIPHLISEGIKIDSIFYDTVCIKVCVYVYHFVFLESVTLRCRQLLYSFSCFSRSCVYLILFFSSFLLPLSFFFYFISVFLIVRGTLFRF